MPRRPSPLESPRRERVLSPESGQKGSSLEDPEKVPSRVQTPNH
jgi:hypothetical protein